MSLHIRVILLIMFISMINYFDRSAISFAIAPIEKDLGLTNFDFGLIASGWGFGYIIMIVIGGFLADRFGAIRLWPMSAVAWSLATISMGFAQGFTSLLILRIILGLAEGAHFPCLLRVISDWLPPQSKTRFIALGLLGVPIASVIGAPLISWLIIDFTWRVMFVILGSLGFLWTFLWILFFRGRAQPSHQQIQSTHSTWRQILASRSFQLSCFIYFSFGYTLFFVLMWMPGFLEQTFGTNLHRTGILVMFPWILSSIFLLLGGLLSDRILRSTGSLRKARSFVMGAGIGLSGLFFMSIGSAETLFPTVLLMSIGLGCAFAINAPVYALASDLFHKNAATANGIQGFFFALSGILAPFITGWLSEATKNFNIAIYIAATLSIISALLAFFFLRPSTPTHLNWGSGLARKLPTNRRS